MTGFAAIGPMLPSPSTAVPVGHDCHKIAFGRVRKHVFRVRLDLKAGSRRRRGCTPTPDRAGYAWVSSLGFRFSPDGRRSGSRVRLVFGSFGDCNAIGKAAGFSSVMAAAASTTEDRIGRERSRPMRGLIWGSVSTTLVVAVVLVASTACNVPQEGAMDNAKLQTLIESLSQDIEGEPGYWSFTLASRQVVVITDEAADRMRIMTPVVEDSQLPAEQARTLLEANFDRATRRTLRGIARIRVVRVHPSFERVERGGVRRWSAAGRDPRRELRNELHEHGPRVPGRAELSLIANKRHRV